MEAGFEVLERITGGSHGRATRASAGLHDSVFALRNDLASVHCGGRHLESSRDVYHTGFREKPGAPVVDEQPVPVLGTIPEVSSTASEQLQDQLGRLCFLDTQVLAMSEMMGAVETCLQTRVGGVEVVVHTHEDQFRCVADSSERRS